jgi:hypothetical protein
MNRDGETTSECESMRVSVGMWYILCNLLVSMSDGFVFLNCIIKVQVLGALLLDQEQSKVLLQYHALQAFLQSLCLGQLSPTVLD